MKKNQKGFTLVELLAVIVILAVIILIAVNAVLPQMRKARKNSFIDEAINFAKAAETAHVSDQISGKNNTCYTVKYLQAHYVSKASEDYDGYVQLTINGDDITKRIWITDGSNFYVTNVDPSSTKNFEDQKDSDNHTVKIVKDFESVSDWTSKRGSVPTGCIDIETQQSGE